MGTARELIPEGASLEQLRSLAAGCQACDLYRNATQTVFGEGSVGATVMLVGEQPGDREDLDGEPFVGPAGALLDRALGEAGIDRRQAYVTNVVKHFKWRPAGKRRLHQKPGAEEIRSCRPWLESEIDVVGPAVVVCLGATAAQALLGAGFRVTRQRGQFVAWGRPPRAPRALATVHPSSILRAPDEEARSSEMEAFVADLAVVARFLDGPVGQEAAGPELDAQLDLGLG
ncbi:MAG: UdgX family uracil-DNA binding protein [Actinomycetota bacterium]|nr:UdgX family uracil-DNA binding protein [Actinomycetota bacterium]